MSKKTIYLDDAIDALKRLQKDISGDYTDLDPMVMAGCGYIGDCIGEIQDLPSAQPERPKGNWVEIGDEPYDEWECDVCGFVIDLSGCIDPEEYRDVYRFCPRCGSGMRGEQDD